MNIPVLKSLQGGGANTSKLGQGLIGRGFRLVVAKSIRRIDFATGALGIVSLLLKIR
jgi:restriction endonuclease